jgi:hypothetical protein
VSNPEADFLCVHELGENVGGRSCGAAPLFVDARIKSGDGHDGRLRMPAELLRLALRALAELDVDQPGPGEVHQLVERATNVLGVLDIGAPGSEPLGM